MSEPLQDEQDRMEGTTLGDKSRRSFLWNLNGGPDIKTFNPTPTPGEDNDFIILDFLLVLEMLEMQFYRLNVAKFFPGF